MFATNNRHSTGNLLSSSYWPVPFFTWSSLPYMDDIFSLIERLMTMLNTSIPSDWKRILQIQFIYLIYKTIDNEGNLITILYKERDDFRLLICEISIFIYQHSFSACILVFDNLIRNYFQSLFSWWRFAAHKKAIDPNQELLVVMLE